MILFQSGPTRGASLTEVCIAVERFWAFEPATRQKAVACSATELGVGQIHFYAIAHLLGLGGAA